jgi:hypothetical protein
VLVIMLSAAVWLSSPAMATPCRRRRRLPLLRFCYCFRCCRRRRWGRWWWWCPPPRSNPTGAGGRPTRATQRTDAFVCFAACEVRPLGARGHERLPPPLSLSTSLCSSGATYVFKSQNDDAASRFVRSFPCRLFALLCCK